MAVHRDWLEEDRDRHAHAHGLRDIELVGIAADFLRVVGKDEHAAGREIGCDHLERVGTLRIALVLVA